MKPKPKNRTRFISDGDELNHLADLIEYLPKNRRKKDGKVAKVLNRFGTLLASRGLDDGSILLQRWWALYFETIKDYARAIKYREQEVFYIGRLLAIGGPVDDWDESFLVQEMLALAHTCEQAGELTRAESVRQECRRLTNSSRPEGDAAY